MLARCVESVRRCFRQTVGNHSYIGCAILAMMYTVDELRTLPPGLIDLLRQHGFDENLFESLASTVGLFAPDNLGARNRVSGEVLPPLPSDISRLSCVDGPTGSSGETKLYELGMDAISRGQLAFVVLAGGMATRMDGVVKALVEVFDGHSFLDIRLAENRKWSLLTNRDVPLWMMTSHVTDAALREALVGLRAGDHVVAFQQNLSLRLAPNGSLFRGADGLPSVYAPGHGDLPDALKRAGLLRRFIDGGGRFLWIANIDNIGACIDPTVLGWHIQHGAAVTVEVVDKAANDRGGIPVRWDGKPVVLEEFRLPQSFDPSTVGVFNTNTFLVDAVRLADIDFAFTWFQVRKKVDGFDAIQFERLIGEITTPLPTRFVSVPREGVASRFIPVKDHRELEQRRQQIRSLVKARRIIG